MLVSEEDTNENPNYFIVINGRVKMEEGYHGFYHDLSASPGKNVIWVIVDHLTQMVHFNPFCIG